MAGYKEFDPDEILASADVNGFLMNQSNLVFDDIADRDAQVANPVDGMRAYLKDSARTQEFRGSDWFDVAKVIKQVRVLRDTNVVQSAQAALVCDTINFTPTYSDSFLVLEWRGSIFLNRDTGSEGDFTGAANIVERDADGFGTVLRHARNDYGIMSSSSGFNESFKTGLFLKQVIPSPGTEERQFQTTIVPNSSDFTIFSVAASNNKNYFSVTEFAFGPSL